MPHPPTPPSSPQLGLDPTNHIFRSAKDAGFSDVHDYLVHLVTGESADAIAARKPAQPWGAWLTGHVVERATAAVAEVEEEEGPAAAAAREDSVSGSCCTAGAAAAQVRVPLRSCPNAALMAYQLGSHLRYSGMAE